MSDFLCRLSDVSDGGATSVVVKGRRIAVVRFGETAHALEDRCPHWGGPLSQGEVSAKRREIICPWHRFRYALDSGACAASPSRRAARTFAVSIQDGWILADIPAADGMRERVEEGEGN